VAVTDPDLSIVVLAWNKMELTRRCVDSIRSGTRGIYELIIVDNASSDGGADYALAAGDKAVTNTENLGFAAGNNSGLAVANGKYVAFVNNDTVLPSAWDLPITQTLDTEARVGMVLPAVTAAGNPVTVRTEPGEGIEVLLPFGEFPSGVVVALRRSQLAALGGWNEGYERASGEDLDLAFTLWAHGLDVALDTRVLVEHVSQASMREVPGLTALYRRNLDTPRRSRGFEERDRDSLDQVVVQIQVLSSVTRSPIDSRQWGNGSSPRFSRRSEARTE
jgi:GT2 family glycosyltransferase